MKLFPQQPRRPDPNREYDLRRVINRASCTKTDMDFGQNILTTDITNVYNDIPPSSEFYVASNSLPSKLNSNIPDAPFFENINAQLNQVTVASDGLKDLNTITGKYQKIRIVETETPFVTGDEVFYESTGATFNEFGEGNNILATGIGTGSYFVEVLGNQEIKLYSSRSFITTGNGLELDYPKKARAHQPNF